mgnify:CR=1 FL=1|tara:strand:- start:668 stop:1138 length:471 start_codon:yes stop_codon:yes gene_type:complete
MSQIINIQYSIDMQDLESEVDRLLFRAINKLSKTAKEVDSKSNAAKKRTLLSSELLEELTDTREKLATIDRGLQDIVEIIGGYVSYKIDLAQPAAVGMEEDLDPESAAAFQQQMESLKNALAPTEIDNLVSAPDEAKDANLQKKIEDFRVANNLNG